MLPTFRFFTAFLVLILGLGLAGCGKTKTDSQGATAFDNTKPEIKEAWSKAVTADKANDYITAVQAYKQVIAHQADLSEAQFAAAQKASGSLNERMVNSALSGDAVARQALDTLRKTELRR